MKSFWLEDQAEFQKSDKLLKISLMERKLTLVSIQMKLFVMVLPSKVVLFVVKNLMKQKV